MTLKRQENIVYLAVWAIVFLFPLTRLLSGNYGFGPSSAWDSILRTWLVMVPLLILFLIHNFFIAPLLVEQHHKVRYFLLAALLMVMFGGYVFLTRDRLSPDRQGPDRTEWRRPDGPPDRPKDGPMERPGPPDQRGGPEGRQGEEGFKPSGERLLKAPMRPLAPEMVKLLMALLVIGANLSIKQFFKAIRDQRNMEELEQEKLASQLRYLRYQISPHFFMNTLNNIHALVDIDPEKAKESIVQLSKLMRYMLYEGDKPTIPIEKEINFLTQYVSLMRLRYDDSVKISLSLPEEASGAEIPPLLFINFVENAFKHGISYQEESFVDVSMKIEGGRLLFGCRNSKHEEHPATDQGGIGVGNTSRRLDLLYGDNYTMDVTSEDGVYDIRVDIPSTP